MRSGTCKRESFFELNYRYLFRVGDNLLAINNESLSGKPISLVRDAIRLVPRGEFQILLRASNEEEDKPSPKQLHPSMDDAESYVTTATARVEDDNPTELPLPNDTKSQVPTQRQTSFSMKADVPAPNVFRSNIARDFDVYSDVTSLPPAPPRPMAPEGYTDEIDSDVESYFSCIPAPPPPITNFKVPVPSSHSRDTVTVKSRLDSQLQTRYNMDTASLARLDFDDSKSDFYMPPPPPRVSKCNINSNVEESECSEESDYGDFERNRGGQLKPPTGDSNQERGEDEYEYKKRMSIEIAQRFVDENQSIESQQQQQHAVQQEEPTEIYYPRSYHQSKDKKKSLFSRLKSKLLLPSKSELDNSGYDQNANYRKSPSSKNNKKKQRPVSVADFRDTSSRNKLKSSISQPDLTVQTADTVDGKRRLRKFDSLDEQSFMKEFDQQKTTPKSGVDSGSTPDLNGRSSSLGVKQLPRILSFRKQKSTEKKKRKNSRHNISPPHTPPPPPPSDQRELPKSNEFEPFSPYDMIPSPTYDDEAAEESPYEVIDKFKFSGNHSYALSEASTSSQWQSYAAEGPSILKDGEDCSFENVLENGDRNALRPNVNKPPPPPPRPSSLHVSPQMKRHHEIGIIETEEEQQEKERPMMTKRESSLLALQFPPPPTGSYSDEQSSPLATSSVENSLEMSDDDILPGLGTSDKSSPRHPQTMDISEKDKNDPKLQPFFLPEDTHKSLVSPRDTNYGNYADDDDMASDWGSEFSSSVVDYTPQRRATTSRYASHHRANMFNISTKSSTPSLEQELDVYDNTPKRLSQDLKNLFSKQRSVTTLTPNGAQLRPPTANKERRKQVKSLPASNISEPVLMKRQTFAELFSQKEVNALGASPAENPSLDAIVNKTIRRNLGDPCVDIDTTDGKKNPIPKPPRGQLRTSESSFENDATKNLDQCYQDVEEYHRSSSIIGRPLPTPDLEGGDSKEDAAFLLNNSSLSEDELNQLYAKVDFSKKRAGRVKLMTSQEVDVPPMKVYEYVNGDRPFEEGYFKIKVGLQHHVSDLYKVWKWNCRQVLLFILFCMDQVFSSLL